MPSRLGGATTLMQLLSVCATMPSTLGGPTKLMRYVEHVREGPPAGVLDPQVPNHKSVPSRTYAGSTSVTCHRTPRSLNSAWPKNYAKNYAGPEPRTHPQPCEHESQCRPTVESRTRERSTRPPGGSTRPPRGSATIWFDDATIIC